MEYFVEQQLQVVTEHQFRVVLPDTLEARTELWACLAESGAWRPRPSVTAVSHFRAAEIALKRGAAIVLHRSEGPGKALSRKVQLGLPRKNSC
jgi:hypothetical protein